MNRERENRLKLLADKFPAVAIVGPRQSGKSTLAKMTFPNYEYVSLEDPDIRNFASSDPRGFLNHYSHHAILDGVQQVPGLFSYLQTKMDADNIEGQYILSGSRNFQLMSAISQSLAGRVAILDILPFSRHELRVADKAHGNLCDWIYQGGFPRIYDKQIAPVDYYPSYVQTYLERDIRNILNVGNLDDFRKFMRLCAGRIGNILNTSSLAADAGIDSRTAKKWLSSLEESYVISFLQPYFNNFKKRLVKSPKLYFCDTGLACSLLGLTSAQDVFVSPFRGALFENMVLLEFLKRRRAQGKPDNVWFWHETSSNEIDFIYGAEHDLNVVEVKSGETFDMSWFNSMNVFSKLAGVNENNKTVVYGGDKSFNTSRGKIISWDTWGEGV